MKNQTTTNNQSNCLFCRIIKGEISCHKIFENEKTLAFLDIAEDFYAHTLVVPKNHCNNIYDATPDDIAAVMETVQKVAAHYADFGFEGCNILIANQPCAEQCVFHLHIHIIPRKPNDGLKIFPCQQKQNLCLEEICGLLKF